MSTTHRTWHHATTTPDTRDTDTQATSTLARRALAVLRIAFGLTFLWAFFDKLLALGFATGRRSTARPAPRPSTGSATPPGSTAAAPPEGFLKFGADGPFKDFYNSIAGDAWADWLFMLGLLGIGLALTFGVGMRIAAAAGALLYVMMWTVVLPPENNPVIDDHILGAITMVVLGRHQRRQHLGTRPPLGGDRAGEAEHVPPLNSPPHQAPPHEPPGPHPGGSSASTVRPTARRGPYLRTFARHASEQDRAPRRRARRSAPHHPQTRTTSDKLTEGPPTGHGRLRRETAGYGPLTCIFKGILGDSGCRAT